MTQKRTEDGKEAWVPLEVDMIDMLKEQIRLSDVELNLSPEKKEANTSRLLGKIGRFFQGY